MNYTDLPARRPLMHSMTLPAELRESLLRYAEHRIPTGGFLAAVLSNDLFEAVGRASENNVPFIPHLCTFIYNTLPAGCWGSREKVAAWLGGRELVEQLVSVEDSP